MSTGDCARRTFQSQYSGSTAGPMSVPGIAQGLCKYRGSRRPYYGQYRSRGEEDLGVDHGGVGVAFEESGYIRRQPRVQMQRPVAMHTRGRLAGVGASREVGVRTCAAERSDDLGEQQ
eukprot:1388189-Rhodomonas_salina.1